MIKIYPIALTRKELFSISLYLTFKRAWMMPIILALMLIVISEKYSIALFFVYLLLMVFLYVQSAKRVVDVLKTRPSISYIEFTDNFIRISYIDDSYSKMRTGRYIKAVEVKGRYYCLFIDDINCQIFNKIDFKTKEDLEWFEKNIFFKIKHQRL